MKILYVETSAFLRVLFQEPGHEEISHKLESYDRLITSRLLKLESERAIIRAAKLQGVKRESTFLTLHSHLKVFWTQFDCIEISREICDWAGQLAPEANLRSLDAIHAATYRWLKLKVSEAEFLTCDQRLQELGF